MIESIYDNDLLFTCSLIEYIGRVTKNEGSLIVNTIGKNGLDRIYQDAEVMHCENIEAVANEFIIVAQSAYMKVIRMEKC